jgi:hypothetical protein
MKKKQKILMIIGFIIILFLVIFFLINNNSCIKKLNNLEKKIIFDLESINYCDIDDDCKFSCCPGYVAACPKYFLFNKNKIDKADKITSKIMKYYFLVLDSKYLDNNFLITSFCHDINFEGNFDYFREQIYCVNQKCVFK